MLYKVVVVFSPCRRTGLDVGAIPPRQSIVVCASATDISRLGLSLGVYNALYVPNQSLIHVEIERDGRKRERERDDGVVSPNCTFLGAANLKKVIFSDSLKSFEDVKVI